MSTAWGSSRVIVDQERNLCRVTAGEYPDEPDLVVEVLHGVDSEGHDVVLHVAERLAEHISVSMFDPETPPPPVITICGSTRFRKEIEEANRDLTLAGSIVLAPGVFGHDGDPMTDAQKVELDNLHLSKIDISNAVYVVNPGGYIGESTAREIAYARQTGKYVGYLVDEGVKA